MLGAVCGYIIKNTLISDTNLLTLDYGALFGSVALGLVISLFVSRKPETVKAITVEDLIGGLIIGVLSGIYSEAILLKLQAIL
tara:strand:- start:285 stop:533 length:249 start_codon:yes stop_codon:yes gene_type:complete